MPALHPLLRFALLSIGFYLVWFFGYEQYLAIDGRLDDVLTHNIAAVSAVILRLLGFPAAVSSTQANLILLANQPTVFIGAYCDGMVLYALFSGFVLAFPGGGWHKLWFVPLGVFLIYSVNILRIVALCLNHQYSHQTVDFNHHYTFTFIVYGFIFLLWIWWATRLAARNSASSAQHAHA
jgi:exosortase family protein XrtF